MCVITSNLARLLPPRIDVKIYGDMSYHQAALVLQHDNLLKKFHDDKMSKKARLAALAKFCESNSVCEQFELSQESYYYDIALRVRDRLYEIFHSGPMQSNVCNLYSFVDHCMPGPGASISTRESSFYGKLFQSKLSTYDKTGTLYRFWSENLSYRWLAAEKARNAEYGLDFVEHSKMSFAHKNLDEARTINTEASLEMLLQKGAAQSLLGLLKKYHNIDMSRQPKVNQMLARLGSIDGSFATIDLKDGSNRISTKLMKFLLPPEVFLALDRIRAKRICVPKSLSDVGDIETHMFSTQGNGFNSALQTLIFATITEVCYESLGLPTDTSSFPHYSVFGDDIICVNSAFDRVVKMLEYCGFTVNKDKSFNTGSFRESCGADFFKGHNIRSVYIKRIRHEYHKYSVFNRIVRWSVRCGVDVSDVLRYLKGLVVFRPVPLDSADDAGIKQPYDSSFGLKQKHGSVQYIAYEPRPRFIRIAKRYVKENPSGLFVSILHGSISSRVVKRGKRTVNEPLGPVLSVQDGFLERSDTTRYVLRTRSTSSWDFCPKGLTPLDYNMVFYML